MVSKRLRFLISSFLPLFASFASFEEGTIGQAHCKRQQMITIYYSRRGLHWVLGSINLPEAWVCVCGGECECWGALHVPPVCLVVSLGVGAAGCCVGVNGFAAKCVLQPEQLGLGGAAHGPYPKPCQDLHLPQHPIHQPQLAKGGRAIVVFDTRFMGKKAVQHQHPHVVVYV